MASATLNLSVVEKRMLSAAEAAAYTGLPIKYFKADCHVTPVELRPGALLWDKRDLDKWIDDKKGDSALTAHADILGKL